MSATSSWFAVRVDMIVLFLMLFMTLLCMFLREYSDPVLISLILNYQTSMQFALMQLSKQYMVLEQQMVSFERCENLTKVVQEK